MSGRALKRPGRSVRAGLSAKYVAPGHRLPELLLLLPDFDPALAPPLGLFELLPEVRLEPWPDLLLSSFLFGIVPILFGIVPILFGIVPNPLLIYLRPSLDRNSIKS